MRAFHGASVFVQTQPVFRLSLHPLFREACGAGAWSWWGCTWLLVKAPGQNVSRAAGSKDWCRWPIPGCGLNRLLHVCFCGIRTSALENIFNFTCSYQYLPMKLGVPSTVGVVGWPLALLCDWSVPISCLLGFTNLQRWGGSEAGPVGVYAALWTRACLSYLSWER